jgi:3-hydroxybutyryl-CoA dehydrogenase
MTVRSVGVVGAGTMGSGIAQSFAQAGFNVRLVDTAPVIVDRARRTITNNWARLVEKGRLAPAERDAAVDRLATGCTLSDLQKTDYVIEAIVEDADRKRALFVELDATLPPDVVLASNTSSIPISSLAAFTGRPDRVLGMHFMNPVPLMTLVEVIRGADTSQASMSVAFELCTALGKTAVESADRPGFIANRVLLPMINEAIFAVYEGVGPPEAVDTVMRLGMNHPMGPLTLADLIGLDVCLAILRVLRDGLGPKYAPCPLLEWMVADGKCGRKSGEGFYRYSEI